MIMGNIRRVIVTCLGCFLMLALAHTAGATDARTAERQITDALGRAVQITSSERILTLGSDISEIVVALDAENRIVAVDRGSSFPERLQQKPNVGYRRALNAEGIVALSPDLIIASEDVATPQALDMLTSFGLPVIFIKIDNSLEGLKEKIRAIANILQKVDEGRQLEKRVVDDFENAAAIAAAVPTDARKRVIFFHGLLRFTAAGDGTAADAIIRYAGGINPVGFEGYKSLSEEMLLDMQPDTILMLPDAAGGPTPDQAFANVALQNTTAGKNRSLIVLKGAYMINFGPRTAEAIRSLATTLYPDQQSTASTTP
jgi:iron complex transport system substrate-binding protein